MSAMGGDGGSPVAEANGTVSPSARELLAFDFEQFLDIESD